jgi:pimeloyl-ACP methyl ester carboxylesterase
MTHEMLTVPIGDGRSLEVLVSGPRDGHTLVFHGGLPSAAVPFGPLDRIAAGRGLRLVTYSRPGYGGSTPRADGGTTYRVSDDVSDTAAILAHLGVDEVVTLGWSGGGPRSLACAALLPGCRAATSLAGIAPCGVGGMDQDAWLVDMGPENVHDFLAALEGVATLQPFADEQAAGMTGLTADLVAASFGQLLSEVNRAAVTGEFADFLARSSEQAAAQGSVGLRDDVLAVSRPWGFDLATLDVPVSVWQGRHDRMVPFGHGVWLADHVPQARRHLYDDEGHLTLVAQLDRIVDDLLDLAGWA